MTRLLRFATQTGGAPSGAVWLARARQVESLGYGTLAMPDHVVGGAWAPFPALAAAAVATTTLRLGTLVLDNDFRHPLLLAREAAVVDVVSNGRLELGVGAGWYDKDYASLGMSFDPGRVRVERLAEAISVLKRLFAGEELTHEGRYYRLAGATSKPATVQRPHPPIMVAGGGPVILDLAGREANIAALIAQAGPTGRLVDPGQVSFASGREKAARVRDAAKGRDVELSCFLDVVLTDDREKEIRAVAERAQVDATVVAGSMYRPIGTLDDVRRHIERVRDEVGVTYFCIRGPHVDECAPLVRELTGRA
ncbi:MAG TPA: TIGR03621 family F420-dependent LLM class oxidoreductase [Candidatus Limnocylindria bacterium]|nr:TIGR03621 family F420-dependent LLM class oxidoreductase [Candidatus Limnocylindria bacterium]